MTKRSVSSSVHHLWHVEENGPELDLIEFTPEELQSYDDAMQALREVETMIEAKLTNRL